MTTMAGSMAPTVRSIRRRLSSSCRWARSSSVSGREPVCSASFSSRQSRPENRPLLARASAGLPPSSMSFRHSAVFSSISRAPPHSLADSSTESSMLSPLDTAMDMEDANREAAIWPSTPRPPKLRRNQPAVRSRSAGTKAVTSPAAARITSTAATPVPALASTAPALIIPRATAPMRTPSWANTLSNTGSTWVTSSTTTATITMNSVTGTATAPRMSAAMRSWRS